MPHFNYSPIIAAGHGGVTPEQAIALVSSALNWSNEKADHLVRNECKDFTFDGVGRFIYANYSDRNNKHEY